jgi:glycosyltransferase involved in cell wall biosynthesis
MRRVLFVSYWVPPRNAIGTIRSSHLLKHLRAFNWEATVVTAQFDDCANVRPDNYVETGYWDAKSFAIRAMLIGKRDSSDLPKTPIHSTVTKRGVVRRLIYETASILTYRDEHIGWLPFASRAISRMVRAGGWDAVLSSAPPMTASVAAALSHRSVPWVADFRDLWAEDDSMERSRLQRFFEDKFERAVVSRAAALIASSDLSAARFQRRYPRLPCFSISTGFDTEEWESIDFGSEERCTILYAGSLYQGKRDPSSLFIALRDILDNNMAKRDEIRIDFYTAPEPWLAEIIGRFGLQDVVRVRGFVPRKGVLAGERRADRLLLLLWDGPTVEGVVPGKLFEYFGARRPVLAIGGPSSSAVEQLLQDTGAGVHCTTVEQIRANLLDAIAEHRNGTKRVIKKEAVQAYSGENCARRFAAVLDHVADRKTSARERRRHQR